MDRQTAQDLRDWAKGIYTIEAAVELLIRYQGGRFAGPGEPWIVPPREKRRGNMHWLDVDQLTAEATAAAVLSGGERRVLSVVASLAGGGAVDLSDAVTGLDRETLDLVLAAIAHASGSHEHRVMGTRTFRDTTTGERFEREWPTEQPAGSLHPWPPEADAQPSALRVVTNEQEDQ